MAAMKNLLPYILGAVVVLANFAAFAAAGPADLAIQGRGLSLLWVLPFAGILMSIALLPVLSPHFWEHHHGKIAAFWAACFVVPDAMARGFGPAAYEVAHTLLAEYVPFVVLIFALYTVAGGVRVTGTLNGTPAVNTAILAAGTVLASVMGTTGAAMLLVQPLIRANAGRRRQAHVFVFFIILVGNIGGSLTPLGDPPLFLGYLEGVDFFWVTRRMFAPMVLVAVPLLALFYVWDRIAWRGDAMTPDAAAKQPLGLDGKRNLILLLAVIAAVLAAGAFETGVAFEIYHVRIKLEDALRTVVLALIGFASLAITRGETRTGNEFSWFPMQEVAKLFFGVFIAMIPALAIVRAGAQGPAAAVVALLSQGDRHDVAAYFWLTGLFSSVLDNAPTYLIFFNLAGGDENALMGPLAGTLLAISVGSVFMGANTYIGNAPNFLIRSMCEARGVKMPSFAGYALWATAILLPFYVLLTWLFFR